MLKKLPPARFDLLFPPVIESEHFGYFQDSQNHPFRYDASGFERVNAWWLAEAALLAYDSGPLAVEKFRAAGLEVAGAAPFEHGRTQCYVVFDDRLVIVAFRGTEPLRPDRWESFGEAWRNLGETAGDTHTDLRFALAESSPGSGRFVHRGFQAALEGIWAAVRRELDSLGRQRPARTFWFTGHSLGAALATLAADRFPAVRGLYTFGSPKVGDRAFVRSFQAPCFRFVNNHDIVARLPPAGPYLPPEGGVGLYHHVGTLKHIDANGRLLEAPGRWSRPVDWLRGQQIHLARGIREAQAGRPWGLAPDTLNDHAPLLYAVGVWNLYASQGSPVDVGAGP